VCCLAIAAGVFGQVWLNEGFRVQAAEVRGQVRVSAEDISRASAVAGRSIFQIRPTAVAGQISRVPGVAEATVHLRLPNQVIIDVIEHQPWIAWKVITDTVWLAADGLTTVPIAGQSPAFTLVDEAGAALDNAGRLKLYVFAGLKALHAARPELAEVYYGRAEGLFYRAPEGWTVYLGDTGKIASKLALLQAIQAEPALRSKRPVVIDLRSEGRAEIR
jgi:cell division septal protein FtsQ